MPLQLDISSVRPYICLDCIAGSKAYALETPSSDDDFKGVFLAPLPMVLTGEAPHMVQDEKHDRQYTELGAFCRELELNNSGALELWACIGGEQELFCEPWLKEFLGKYQFLSKRCYYTYKTYADRQLKRIYATHSKAVNPPPKVASAFDFAAIVKGDSLLPLNEWLKTEGRDAGSLSARRLAADENLYALYEHSTAAGLFGRDGTMVATPSIPPNAQLIGTMLFRATAYSQQLKRCAQYREWTEKRNPSRLSTAPELDTEQGLYDTKHMGHVFRLLHTAKEIATEGRIHVRRTWDNAFLRAVRAGQYPLDELMKKVESEMAELKTAFDQSDLPDSPCIDGLWDELAQLRIALHHENR